MLAGVDAEHVASFAEGDGYGVADDSITSDKEHFRTNLGVVLFDEKVDGLRIRFCLVIGEEDAVVFLLKLEVDQGEMFRTEADRVLEIDERAYDIQAKGEVVIGLGDPFVAYLKVIGSSDLLDDEFQKLQCDRGRLCDRGTLILQRFDVTVVKLA